MKQRLGVLIVSAFVLLSLSAWAQEKSMPATKEKAASTLTVSDAKLGTAIKNKQITGETATFDLNQKVYLWLELKGGPADDVTVTWKNGDKSYQTTLKVGGPTYHTWAFKTAAIAGSWSVAVTDASGSELKRLEFTVGQAVTK